MLLAYRDMGYLFLYLIYGHSVYIFLKVKEGISN